MPAHKNEEEAESHIFDKVAKQSDSSTASNHPMHGENEEPVKAKAEVKDLSNKGPQVSENMPEAKGKDELRAKAAEMNK